MYKKFFIFSSYSFHKAHCSEALEYAAENVDKALEILFRKYFNVTEQIKPENVPTQTELLEMRMDEKAVLESIYEHSFKVKDTNVWTVKLNNLDYITKLYETQQPQVKKRELNANYKTKKKEACKLFLRGSCRFGAKCKFSHETVENKPIEVEHKNEKITYELEIRFTDDTIYPFESPLIFFKLGQRTDLIPELTCLKITARLYEEAKILSQDGIPSIYSLVELLNNEDDIVNFIKFDTRTFPDTSKALFPQLIENSDIEKDNLPSHYNKSAARESRADINFDAILKENNEIAKWWLEKRDNNRYNKMMSARRKLPAWQKRTEILNAMKKSQVMYEIFIVIDEFIKYFYENFVEKSKNMKILFLKILSLMLLDRLQQNFLDCIAARSEQEILK